MQRQEMAAERKQSKMTSHSEENKNENCGGILTNDLNSPTKKNENSPSNSGPPSNKQISEFSQNAQSSPGKPSVAEVDQTLSTIMHQSPPMTIISAHVNNVDSIANESSSPTNTIMQQHGTEKGANLRKSSKDLPVYDDIIDEIYNLQCVPDASGCKCRVCRTRYTIGKVRYHLAAIHPEVFFAHIKSRLSSPEAIDEFIARCGAVLQDEIDYAKKKTAEQNPQQTTISCTYCTDEYYDARILKYHMFRVHYDVLEDKLIAYYPGSERISHKIRKTQSRSRRKRNQNLKPGKSPNSRFANNAAKSAVVNTERHPRQNLEYKSMEKSRGQESAQNDKSITANNTVDDGNTTRIAMAPTDWGTFGGDLHYGNFKEILGFSRNEKSTGHQAVEEIAQTLPPTMHQRPPLTTGWLYANNVDNVGNKTSRQTKPVVQQHRTQPVYDGIGSKESPAHHQFRFDDIVKDRSKVVGNNYPSRIKCDICGEINGYEYTCLHLVGKHPEIFFPHLDSQFTNESTPDTTHFSELCKSALRIEIHLAAVKLEGYVRDNMDNMTLPCTYCSDVCLDERRLKNHIVRIHYNLFEKKLIAYCQDSELGRGGKASETGLNVQSTSRTKLDTNVERRQRQTFEFKKSTTSDVWNEMMNREASSRVVKIWGDQSQNSEYKSIDENRGLGFALKDNKNNAPGKTAQEINPTFFAVAEPIAGSSYSAGNVNDQYSQVPLSTVCSSLSSFSTHSNSNHHWSQLTNETVTEGNNHGEAGTTNHNDIQQHYPTIVAPSNSQYFFPPVSLGQQQQVESNQAEISASSQHPSCSTSTTNDDPISISDWDFADFDDDIWSQ